jgi:dihydrofolate reductase
MDVRLSQTIKSITMRKIKLQMQISANGFVAGPNGEMDWMTWNWDDALKKYVTDLTASVDSIIMGRKLAQGFIPYWADVAAKPEDPQFLFGKIMNDAPKIVFTKTLQKSEWENTILAKGNLAEEIAELKKQNGKDIIVYGGANFVSNLIEENLIDELHLFVNPAAIGNGLTIFNNKKNLKLAAATAFDCGIVILKYEPLKN